MYKLLTSFTLLLLTFATTYLSQKNLISIRSRSLRTSQFADPSTKVAKDHEDLQCSKERGLSGKWVEIAPDKKKYKWEDDNCEIKQMTLSNLCLTMEQLQMERIFFIGDSLMFQQFESMLKLLGLVHNDFKEARSKKENDIRSGTVKCPAKVNNYSFKIYFFRSDVLAANRKDDMCEHTECHFCQCRSWIHDYFGSNERTVLIANIGAHCKKFSVYEENFNRFVSQMNRAVDNRNLKDLFFFRTTAPGHVGCKENSIPFQNMAEYEQSDKKDPFHWSSFPKYNNYARKEFERIEKEEKKRWHVLDIYQMTVLRPDRHKRPPQDCLHYNLPGPPDWWNHMLYSSLLDIASSASL